MDSSAIKAISELSADAATAAQSHIPSELALAAIPNGVQLHNLEPYMAGRTRFRGKMTTDSIPDFVSYVKEREGGHGFIDAERLTASVFFNLGDTKNPGHADYTATLGLRILPAFKAMSDNDGEAMSQREVIEFIEDWSHIFGAYKEGDDGAISSIPLAKAVAAIRRIKIEAKSQSETVERNFAQSQSRLDSVEASSDEGLPDVLTFQTVPYHGLSARTFHLRLSILTGGRDPALKFRVIGLDQHKEDIAQEFKSLLISEVGDAATMTIGKFTP